MGHHDNTIQYNHKLALKNWQTNRQFNLAYKLKKLKCLKENEMRDTENRNSVKCKSDKIWKMTEVKKTKIREKNWKGKK